MGLFDAMAAFGYNQMTNLISGIDEFATTISDHGLVKGGLTWAWDELTPWDTQHEVAMEEADEARAAQRAKDKLKKRQFAGAERIHGIRTKRLAEQKDNALEGIALDEQDVWGDYDLAMEDFSEAMGMLDHAKSRALEGIARQQSGATTATAAYGVRGGSSYDHIEHVADEATTDVTKEYNRNTGQLERTATRQTRQFATTAGSDDLYEYYGVDSQEELEQVLAAKGISAPEVVEQGRTDIAREEITSEYESQTGILDENLDLAEAGLDYDMTISGLSYDRIDRGVQRAGDQQFASILSGALQIGKMAMGIYDTGARAGMWGNSGGLWPSMNDWYQNTFGGSTYASRGGVGGGSSLMQSQAPAFRW
jgi:hypothetical protein